MKYIVFGTGDYGKRLSKLFHIMQVEISYYCKSEVNSEKYFEGVPILALDDMSFLDNFCVFIAIADRNTSRIIKNTIIHRYPDKAFAFECADFIENNYVLENQNSGGTYRHCLMCDRMSNSFLAGGEKYSIFDNIHIIGGGYRDNVYCPYCGSKDRERWTYYVIMHYTEILTKRCSVLHFAAEKNLSIQITNNPNCDYYPCDIEKKNGMHVVDMTNIQFKDESFDYIIANHVLEHILEEDKAIQELLRVLKPNGIILLSFPICLEMDTCEEKVGENYSEDDRKYRFGQKDHVRLYGRDYIERLSKYGLTVEKISPKEVLSPTQIEQEGFISDDICILCRKVKL